MSYSVILGINFSGRTDMLRSSVGLSRFSEVNDGKNRRIGAFVGETASAHFLGFSTTVAQEIAFQGQHLPKHRSNAITSYFEMRDLMRTNPFHLSGGEQTLLAIEGALTCRMNVSIDTCVEQLSRELCELVDQSISDELQDKRNIVLCDNRPDSIFNSRAKYRLEAPHFYGQKWRADIGYFDARIFPSNPVSVEFRNVKHRYHGRLILNQVAGRLEPGKVYHLRGANGAGKTTLSRILVGLLKPEEFQGKVGGHSFVPWTDPSATFAYHFQNPDHQFFRSSVRAELNAGTELRSAIPMLMDTLGLTSLIDEHPLDLPFAMRKRVAFASALLMGRPWTILDEPTLGQDASTSAVLADIVKQLTLRGSSFIVITHNSAFMSCLEPLPMDLLDGRLYQ